MKVFSPFIFLLLLSTSIQAQFERQIVYIKCVLSDNQYRICTGFMANISNETFIVTCYHALPEAEQIIAIVNGLPLKKVKLIAYDNTRDIALLSFQKEPRIASGLKLSYLEPKSNIKDCLIYGFPSNWQMQEMACHLTTPGFSLTTKLVGLDNEPIYRFGYLFDIISLSGIVYGGLSGSPVISGGKVIGIFVGSLNDGGSLGWAVPVKYINELSFLPSGLVSPKSLPKYDAIKPKFQKALTSAILQEIPNEEAIDSLYGKIRSQYFFQKSSLAQLEHVYAQEADYVRQISCVVFQANSFLFTGYSIDSANEYLNQLVKLIKSTQSIKASTDENFDPDTLNKLQVKFISLIPKPPKESGIIQKMQILRRRSDSLRLVADTLADSLAHKFSIRSKLQKNIDTHFQNYQAEMSELNFKNLLNAINLWNEYSSTMVAVEQHFYQSTHDFFENFEERAALVYEARKFKTAGNQRH